MQFAEKRNDSVLRPPTLESQPICGEPSPAGRSTCTNCTCQFTEMPLSKAFPAEETLKRTGYEVDGPNSPLRVFSCLGLLAFGPVRLTRSSRGL
jgi:hypothetical protein